MELKLLAAGVVYFLIIVQKPASSQVGACFDLYHDGACGGGWEPVQDVTVDSFSDQCCTEFGAYLDFATYTCTSCGATYLCYANDDCSQLSASSSTNFLDCCGITTLSFSPTYSLVTCFRCLTMSFTCASGADISSTIFAWYQTSFDECCLPVSNGGLGAFGFTDGIEQTCPEYECIGEPCGPGKCTDLLDSEGFYECTCDPGYEPTGVASEGSLTCTDINECADVTICGAGDCKETPGGYKCTCPEGYIETSDPPSCTDRNECEDEDITTCGLGDCINTDGSYTCTCPDGTESIFDPEPSCTDVNECDTEGMSFYGKCGRYGRCINFPAGLFYECLCDDGFEPTGVAASGTRTCTDVDECTKYDGICGEGVCVNIPDGEFYECECADGYEETGDPCKLTRTCTKDEESKSSKSESSSHSRKKSKKTSRSKSSGTKSSSSSSF